MERLLTNNEMVQLMWDFAQTISDEELDKLQQIDRFQMIAAAQDLKTIAWFIKTIELNCGDGHDKPLIQIGAQDWQDFKASLEVK
jgi:hypothetical protein